jgi:hypothetical protein
MGSTKIIVPDFDFSGFYYADILRRIRSFNRVNAPEITAETAEEPFIQAERAFALVGHLNNVLLDLAAQENLLPTAHLADSVAMLLKLIDYQMRDYSPATVELLLTLAQVPTTSVQLLQAATLFETEQTEESEAVPFEVLDELYVGPSNVVDAVFAAEFDRSGIDGETILGDPTAFQSASMTATDADLGNELEISSSLLGNVQTFRIAEVLQSTSPSRVRLTALQGNSDPLFIPETGLSWTIREYTANASAEVNASGAPYFTPWTVPHAGDKLYIGSEHVMWDVLNVTFNVLGVNVSGVWEYYDPDTSDETPESVTNLGGSLRFDLTPLLGMEDRSGALVRATYLPTMSSELLPSAFVSGVNVLDVSAFLGQTGTPSLDPADYSIGTDWNPLPDVVDGTSELISDGDVTYTLPQTLRANWQRVEVQNVEGWFLRFRVVSVSAPTAPVIDRIRIDTGTQYVLSTAVQGETVDNEPLQSSSGQVGQWFELANRPGLRDTVQCYVDEGGGEVEWTNVTAVGDSLLSSGPKDRHFSVDQNALGVLTVRFGDGTRGKVPPMGTDNVRFTYRVNASVDGNVGAGTVIRNSDGASLAAAVSNPRPAGGWQKSDGADDESIALVKEVGPASLRTGGRASAPEDYETLALDFKNSLGSRPVVRAKAIEEGYGPKTIRLVVVGTNGVAISSSDKAELEVFFNGDEVTGEGGVGQANVQVIVDNFTPRLIAPTLVIEANSALTVALVKTQLVSFLNPTARVSDGTQFVWRFGGRVPLSRIAAEVFGISPGNVFDVDVPAPSADLELLEDELPFPDSGNFVISIVAPVY